jgi:hypothetical protein
MRADMARKTFISWSGIVLMTMIANLSWAQSSTLSDGWLLKGRAVKKFLTFRVVTVELYTLGTVAAENVLEDVSKKIVVNYHVNIPKHELDRATIKGIERNVNTQELKKLFDRVEQINSYYPSVKAADQIIITYLPQVGTRVDVNGTFKGIVPGKDFAKAFFAIWIGENPVDKQAKRQLLGG